MLLGARQFFERRGVPAGPTARDYVQDGLVAMWDGIENAGWGVHEDTTSVVNLAGDSGDMSLTSQISDDWYAGGTAVIDLSIAEITFEVVQDSTSVTFGEGGSFGRFMNDATYFGYCWNAGNAFQFIYRNDRVYNFDKSLLLTKSSVSMVRSNSAGLGYVNGSLVGTSARPSIGEATYTSFVSAPRKNTKIHTIRIYSRALTAAEIAANYAVDKRRFNLP